MYPPTGLANLEATLEKLDQPVRPSGGARRYDDSWEGEQQWGGSEAHQQQQQREEEDYPTEQALADAIHISGMASHRQEDALARLPRAGRIKVGVAAGGGRGEGGRHAWRCTVMGCRLGMPACKR